MILRHLLVMPTLLCFLASTAHGATMTCEDPQTLTLQADLVVEGRILGAANILKLAHGTREGMLRAAEHGAPHWIRLEVTRYLKGGETASEKERTEFGMMVPLPDPQKIDAQGVADGFVYRGGHYRAGDGAVFYAVRQKNGDAAPLASCAMVPAVLKGNR